MQLTEKPLLLALYLGELVALMKATPESTVRFSTISTGSMLTHKS